MDFRLLLYGWDGRIGPMYHWAPWGPLDFRASLQHRLLIGISVALLYAQIVARSSWLRQGG